LLEADKCRKAIEEQRLKKVERQQRKKGEKSEEKKKTPLEGLVANAQKRGDSFAAAVEQQEQQGQGTTAISLGTRHYAGELHKTIESADVVIEVLYIIYDIYNICLTGIGCSRPLGQS
jgi:hypothetical protein